MQGGSSCGSELWTMNSSQRNAASTEKECLISTPQEAYMKTLKVNYKALKTKAQWTLKNWKTLK